MIGPDALRPVRCFEVQGNSAIGLAPERSEPRLKAHRVLRQGRRDGRGSRSLPPAIRKRSSDMPVRDRRPPGGCSPEEVYEVEGRLVGRRRAVLERVSHVEKPAEPRRRATGDARLDPLPDAHAVERRPPPASGSCASSPRPPRRGLAGAADTSPGTHDRRRRPGRERPARGTRPPSPAPGQRGDPGSETEAPGEPEDGLMIGVDELSAPLADLAVPPVARGVRVDPATDLACGLVHGGGDAGVVKGQGSREAPQPRPDDGDRGRRLSRRRLLRRRWRLRGLQPTGAERHPGRHRAPAHQERPPRHRGRGRRPGLLRTPLFARSGPLGPDHGGRDATPIGAAWTAARVTTACPSGVLVMSRSPSFARRISSRNELSASAGPWPRRSAES